MRMTGYGSTVRGVSGLTPHDSFIQQWRQRACFIHDENRKKNLNQQGFLPQFGTKALLIILTYC